MTLFPLYQLRKFIFSLQKKTIWHTTFWDDFLSSLPLLFLYWRFTVNCVVDTLYCTWCLHNYEPASQMFQRFDPVHFIHEKWQPNVLPNEGPWRAARVSQKIAQPGISPCQLHSFSTFTCTCICGFKSPGNGLGIFLSKLPSFKKQQWDICSLQFATFMLDTKTLLFYSQPVIFNQFPRKKNDAKLIRNHRRRLTFYFVMLNTFTQCSGNRAKSTNENIR